MENTLSIEKIEDIRTKDLNAFEKAVAKLGSASWALAKVVHGIVTRDNFKEVYGNLKTCAETFGISTSQCSKLTNAYELRLTMEQNGFEIPELSKIQELLPLKDSASSFLTNEELNSMSTEDIREAVKEEKSKDKEDSENVSGTKRKGTYVSEYVLDGMFDSSAVIDEIGRALENGSKFIKFTIANYGE